MVRPGVNTRFVSPGRLSKIELAAADTPTREEVLAIGWGLLLSASVEHFRRRGVATRVAQSSLQ